jgi:hypothetical protein
MVGELEPNSRVYEAWHAKSDTIWPVEAAELNQLAVDLKQCADETDSFGTTWDERAEREAWHDPNDS